LALDYSSYQWAGQPIFQGGFKSLAGINQVIFVNHPSPTSRKMNYWSKSSANTSVGRRTLIASVAVTSLVLVQTIMADATLTLPDTVLLANTANQQVPLYIDVPQGLQLQLGAVDLNIQIGDGGASASPAGKDVGPVITGIDFISTGLLFAGNHDAVPAPGITGMAYEQSVNVNLSGASVIPITVGSLLSPVHQLLAYISLDTTGFGATGQSWTWTLANGFNGPTTLSDAGGNTLSVTLTPDASLTLPVPEPGEIALLGFGCAILWLGSAWRSKKS
jgi:hypothetical protein